MRSVLLIAAVLLTATTARGEIAWRPNLKTAHDEATASGKLILVHFYSDNCVWCERLEQGAFQDPAVAAAIEARFVPVKINGPLEPTFASAFSISRYPTEVIVASDGSVLAHEVSPQNTSGYLAMLSGPQVSGRIASATTAPQTSPAVATPNSPSVAVQAAVQTPPQQFAANVAPAGEAAPGSPAVAVAGGLLGPPAARQPNPLVAGPGPEMGGFAMPPGIAAGNFDMQAFGGTPAIPAGHRGPGSSHSMGLAAPANSNYATPQVGLATEAIGNPQVAEMPHITSNPLASGSDPLPSNNPLALGNSAATQGAIQNLPPEAMDGYCPVTMVNEMRWAQGKPEFGVIHLGQLYLFASAEAQQKFQASPEQYTPVLNGIDVVKFFDERKIAPGSREWGLTDPVHGRMFFFADEASMNHFYEHHQRYVEPAIELTQRAAADANSRR